MFISFFESIKYLGHLWPISVFRIGLGYVYLKEAFGRIHSGFLDQPALEGILKKLMEAGVYSPHYSEFLTRWVIPHWKTASSALVFGELAVGLSFIAGFMVRPFSLVAMVLSAHYLVLMGNEPIITNKLLIGINAALFMVAAGRCIGFDYYFYKRVRGFWW